MENQVKLTLEQKFSIRSFESQVDKMTTEQAKEMLKVLFTKMLVQETQYKELIKYSWFG